MKRKRFSRVDWQVSLLLSILLVLFGISIFLTSSHICYYSILDSLTHRVENRKYAQLCGTRTDARSILGNQYKRRYEQKELPGA